jgi:monoterpene epsilon-lactone hydrolase
LQRHAKSDPLPSLGEPIVIRTKWPEPYRCFAGAIVALALTSMSVAASVIEANGTIHADSLLVPLSNLMSQEARAYMIHLLVDHPFAGGPSATEDITGYREHQDDIMRGFLGPMQLRYRTVLTQETIGGILTDVVVPASGISAHNSHRVLLNVHGGGFLSGAHTAALVESIPIAATLKVKVISIDYRMSPEAQYPAASEDIAAVYREILTHYKPNQIGLYGCSAGGMLTAQAMGWFRDHRLPLPGAIGVLCASLGQLVEGDSAYTAGTLNGFPPMPAAAQGKGLQFAYLSHVSLEDKVAYPLNSPALLARFPPTILVTASRSMEYSAAINSANALTRAGVETEPHVWDGLPHAFFYNSELPESREVYGVVAHFFDHYLSR